MSKKVIPFKRSNYTDTNNGDDFNNQIIDLLAEEIDRRAKLQAYTRRSIILFHVITSFVFQAAAFAMLHHIHQTGG